ncbi:MAG: hypothetical protein V7638_2595 [Acidobacteriota bacterium]|jgi:hypothetical protein
MKVDIYMKVVLSLIAVCLCWLCFKNVNISETAVAQTGTPPREVIIAGVKTGSGFLPVTISGVSSGAKLSVVVTDVATPDHLLPVKIAGITTSNKLLPVSIESVKQGTPWDALSTKAEKNP